VNWYKKSEFFDKSSEQMWYQFIGENPQYWEQLPDEHKINQKFIDLKIDNKDILPDTNLDASENKYIVKSLLLPDCPILYKIYENSHLLPTMNYNYGQPSTILEDYVFSECPYCGTHYKDKESYICPHQVLHAEALHGQKKGSDIDGWSSIHDQTVNYVAPVIENLQKEIKTVYSMEDKPEAVESMKNLIEKWLDQGRKISSTTTLYSKFLGGSTLYGARNGLALLLSKIPTISVSYSKMEDYFSDEDGEEYDVTRIAVDVWDVEGKSGEI